MTQPSHLAVIDKITVLRVKIVEKLLKLAAVKPLFKMYTVIIIYWVCNTIQ